MALATRAVNHGNAGTSSQGGNSKTFHVPDWWVVKGPDSVERDIKIWFWCPHHKMEGKYDGLYVTQKLENHAEWQKQKQERAKKKRVDEPSTVDQEEEHKSLSLSNAMKTVLLSHCDLTTEQADSMMKEAQEHANY